MNPVSPPGTPSAPPISGREFLLLEVQYVRSLHTEAARETRALETYATLASGAIWSWVIANHDAPGRSILLWVPLAITQLLGMRAWVVYRLMRTMRKYLVALEATASLPNGLGWECFHTNAPGRRLRVATAVAFWNALSLGNVTVALLFLFYLR